MPIEPTRVVLAIGALLLGCCVGSFVNVLIYRLPREKSVVSPGSHCFCCGTELAARDLVPMLSLLLAGRRCRYCGVALSMQYSWVEALCGLLYLAIYWRWGNTVTTVAYFIATAALVAGTGTDLRHKIIPNSINQALLFTGLGAALLAWLMPRLPAPGLPSLKLALIGAVVGWCVFEAIVRLGRWWFGQEAMGGGDVLLAAGVGALIGPGRQFAAFFLISILAGALIGGLLLVSGRMDRRDPIPFGPFLVLGALAVMLAPELGHQVAALYGF